MGRETTDKVKNALHDAGFRDVSVEHGRGTAAGWIHVTLYGQYSRADEDRAYMITKKASGREHLYDDISTDLFMVNIIVQTRAVRPPPRPKPKYSRKGEIRLASDETREYGVDKRGRKMWRRYVRVLVGDYTYQFEETWYNGYTFYRYDPSHPDRLRMPKREIAWDQLLRTFSRQPDLQAFLIKTFPQGQGKVVNEILGKSPGDPIL